MFRVVRLISTGVSSLVGLRQIPTQKALAGLIFNSHRSCLSSMAATLTSDKIKAVHDDIIKSAEDKRSYRGLVLNNDMKVFLVSDPTTDKSSAALDVNIGSMSDPSELPGLAHFCEHMLFLGTEKYPEENEYNKFLSEHGGSSNAFTSGEHTNYFFDVAPEHLDGALDRFAQFFLCPLFTASATDREVNAVNSENDKNIPNDSWRLFQLEKSTADPNHAYCRFSTGNKETLDVIPKQNGLDVREELLKFHKKFYSSNLMGICILGKESLDELTDMVVPLFSGVENKNVPVPEWKEHPYGPEQLKLMGSVVPIKDIRSLNVTWPIPDLHPYYKCNPGHYLGHLIGHEGPGSLLSELKSRGWVNQLLGGQKSGGNGFMFFIVNVDLSEEGIDHVDDIVTLIFQYLNMLRREGPQGWVFKECQDLNAMQFRFKDKEKPRNYTCQIAGCLPDYPIKEILSASMLLGEFKPELIDMVLDCLTPDRIRVAVISQHFAGKTDQKEKWYGTEYSLKSISEETIQKWKDADVHENLKLPLRNEFIPTDFEICERDKEPSTLPHVIRDTAMTRMWYKQDDKFLLPKCCISLELTSPYAYMDPLSTNLTYMFTSLFQDALTEFAYDAELAGLNYDLHNTIYGLTLGFRGYSDKMHILLKKVIEKMTSFKVDAQRFELLKDNYVRALKNFRAEQPHQHAVYFCSVLTSELMWTKEELLDATEELTVERVQAFIPQVLSRLYLEFLVYGNTSREKAEEIGNMVENMLQTKAQTKPLLPSQQKRFREVQMPDGCYYVYKRSNDVHRSSSLEVYYQCNIQDTHTNMVLELFCQIISEPCFDILRTQEQLGYIVFSGVRRSHGIQGLRVIVQSDKTPEYVEGRIEAFLHKMESHIAEISQESFDNHIEALATKRLEKPKKMSTQNARYWSEIISQLYNFERDDIEVNHLRTLKKEDILSFYKELIAHNAPKRHKLSVHVMSTLDDGKDNNKCDAPDGLASPPACIQASEIVDINEFKRGLGLFPLPKPFIDIQNTKSKL